MRRTGLLGAAAVFVLMAIPGTVSVAAAPTETQVAQGEVEVASLRDAPWKALLTKSESKSTRDNECVRTLDHRYPRQPNRVMSVGVFNICNYTLRNVHASVYNRPGFEMNSTGRMDLPPEQGIVVAVDSYVQWGSSTCGELWEPINGGWHLWGRDCVVGP
ncbi:hypothetical protein [Streptomyces parvus]|uniref:hypothetical protein n=2 Tax=Streptomyces parvus TaxID=66428 RepID=UPI003644AE1C